MRITAIEITDYKRVRKVAITPDADRAVILIGGKNGQGKSSTLDALTAAFGGKRAQASDPVRHGAKEASIFIELDGGKLTIDRVISTGGTSTLEVRDADGAVKAPQAMLDKLIGARFLDPLAFLQLAPKDQRAQLMKLIDGAERIEGLNEKRAKAFERRTELGRELTKAEGELERHDETAVAVGDAIDVAALTAEAKQMAELQRAGDGLGNTYRQCERDTESAKANLASVVAQRAKLEDEVERLKGQVVELGIKSAEWSKDVAKCEEVEAAAKATLDKAGAAWAALSPRRAELDADLARAGEHNRAVFEAEAHAKRRAEAAKAVEKFKADVLVCKTALETIDTRKAEILAAAKLPVDGLAVTDDGVELAGVPFAQASGAERLRVALALAIAASPNLNDVWIHDGALLDDESLEQVTKHAAAAKKRVWIERVGTSDAGVIVIADGQVVS